MIRWIDTRKGGDGDMGSEYYVTVNDQLEHYRERVTLYRQLLAVSVLGYIGILLVTYFTC